LAACGCLAHCRSKVDGVAGHSSSSRHVRPQVATRTVLSCFLLLLLLLLLLLVVVTI
jgi:hypothetical protein